MVRLFLADSKEKQFSAHLQNKLFKYKQTNGIFCDNAVLPLSAEKIW